MDQDILSKVCNQVYSKFPEVNGKKPKIQTQDKADGVNYLVIFSGSGKTANGSVISRVVRVVVSDTGKIIKMTTSR